MSNLVPSLLALDKGLNLQTPKIVAEPGSVLDMLNYEQVDFQGQKRIDGYVRYDGSLLAAIDEYLVIQVVTEGPEYSAGDLVAVRSGMFGVVVSVDDTEAPTYTYYVAINNRNRLPKEGDDIFRIINGSPSDPQPVQSVTTGTLSEESPDEHYEKLLAFNNFLRNRVEGLPGPIAGLHWFRDRLHAIAGVTYISLDGVSPQLFPNDIVEHEDGTLATVLDSFVLDNTRAVFLDAMNPATWSVAGTEIFRDAVSVGFVEEGYEPLGVDLEIASFFESRTEEQVLAEDGPDGPYDFGWKFIPLGWRVNFENGVTLYGGLPSINQNIEGIGVQGPTPISGASGSPRALFQRVSITNARSQVNGWKSSQSPDNYNLTVNNLDTPDNVYIYADAYVTWNGTTGVVSAPGASSNSVLVEYPATNTIEVVI